MTPVTNVLPSRRARKKAATRTRIVAEGLRLFSERGIESVSVDQIAAAADVGKGTIYNYFQTKEDIVVAFMVDLERKVQARVGRLQSSGPDATAALTAFVEAQLRMKRRHHAFVRVFLGHMFLHTEQFLPYLAEMQEVIDPPLAALFRALQRRRLIRGDVGLDELVTVFKTVQLGLTALWAVEGPPFKQVARIIRREVALFCEGLEVER